MGEKKLNALCLGPRAERDCLDFVEPLRVQGRLRQPPGRNQDRTVLPQVRAIMYFSKPGPYLKFTVLYLNSCTIIKKNLYV